jgi:hypothetical protein
VTLVLRQMQQQPHKHPPAIVYACRMVGGGRAGPC